MLKFYEFFAGGGMARAGLGRNWQCLFANDFDQKKGRTYRENWGKGELVVDDIRNIGVDDLRETADLVWGSFPCQDLSLAGGGAGLKGDRSGTFWPFISIIQELIDEGRRPKVVALENVVGTLTSHKGADFVAICSALSELGYVFGAFVADASLFVPQSRPRLFFVAVSSELKSLENRGMRNPLWHTKGLQKAYNLLPQELSEKWIWWDMPKPSRRKFNFRDLIEENPTSVSWHTPSETEDLLAMMSDLNLAKVDAAKKTGRLMVGGVYKRTRYHQGVKVQRAEVRFDDVAGCLRTPAGGSSRQLILVVEGKTIRSRLISARETARLMGLPDSYALPSGYNETYHLTGDGVAVPVVRHIAKHILEPVAREITTTAQVA